MCTWVHLDGFFRAGRNAQATTGTLGFADVDNTLVGGGDGIEGTGFNAVSQPDAAVLAGLGATESQRGGGAGTNAVVLCLLPGHGSDPVAA